MENNNNYQQADDQPSAINHHDKSQDTSNSKKPSKTMLYVLIALGVLLFAAVGYYIGTKDNKEKQKNNPQKIQGLVPDSTQIKDSLHADSTKVVANPVEYEGEEEDGIGTNYVLANEAYLRTAPSETATKTNYNLKFGDRVFVDNSYSDGKYSKVYLTDPSTGPKPPAYYVASYTITYEYEFNKFKQYFSLKPFTGLATKTKRLILDNNFPTPKNTN